MRIDNFTVFNTRCGVVIERFWEERLGHTGQHDCECPICNTNAIYDERTTNGTVCMRCGCTMTRWFTAQAEREFTCPSCYDLIRQAKGNECQYCMAPVINGECTSFDNETD